MRPVRAVAVAGICAQTALATTPALPIGLLPLSAAALLGAVWWSARVTDVPARTRQAVTRVSNVLAVLLVSAALLTAGRSAEVRDLSDHLGPALLALQLLHAATWRTARDLRAGLVVSGGMAVLAAADVRDLVGGLPVLAAWAALVSAGAHLGALAPARAGAARFVVDRPARSPRLVLPATALAVLVGLAVFLVVPLHVPAPPRGRAPAGPADRATGPVGRSVSLSSDRMDLRSRGDLGTRPVLQVPADSPSHWRSTTFLVYDGTTWSGLGPAATGPRPGGERTDRVRVLQPDGTLWAPGDPLELRVAHAAPQAVGQGVLRVPASTAAYTVTSRLPVTDPEQLRAAGLDPVRPSDLQLPPRLPERVRALGRQLVEGAPTRYDAVRAVEAYVRGAATYRLDSPVPAPGEDAVDRFLFVDRVGFCEQFASAEAVLLRAGGIPARVATGLAGSGGSASTRTYRTGDLHAWVEVPYGPLGWSPSDPTPSGTPAATTPRARAAAVLALLGALVDRVPGGRYAVAALLVLAGIAGAAVATRTGRPRRSPVPEDPEGRPALAAFLRLDRRAGADARRPAESLTEVRDRLALPVAALAVVEQECYGSPQSCPDPAGAVRALDAWQPQR